LQKEERTRNQPSSHDKFLTKELEEKFYLEKYLCKRARESLQATLSAPIKMEIWEELDI
jgi:hypothetical protein